MRNIYLNITYDCNSKCSFCAADHPLKVQKGLNLAEIEAVVHKLNIASTDQVIINGGEPTVHPDLLSVLRCFKMRGARLILFTNGVKLANRDFVRELAKAGVDKFTIPLYSDEPTIHNQLTRVTSFAAVVQGIDNVIEFKESAGYELELKTLIVRANYFKLKDILQFTNAYFGAFDRFFISGLIMSETVIANNLELDLEEAKESLNEGVDYALGSKMPFLLDSIPLCIFRKDILMGYLLHRKNMLNKKAFQPFSEYIYYDNKRNEALPDRFNRSEPTCLYRDCLVQKYCRLNPQYFSEKNINMISPILK